MKKKVFLIFSSALLVLILAIVGFLCIQAMTRGIGDADQDAKDVTSIIDVVNQTKEPDFKLVTSVWGLFQPIAGSELGYYELYPDMEKGAELLYHNYRDQEKSSLGLIEDVVGGAVPVVAGDMLYIFKTGDTPMPAAEFEGYESYIMQMDLNGKESKVIKLEKYQTFDYGMAAFDGTYLYFVRNEWNSDEYLTESALCKADFEKGVITKIVSLNQKSLTSIIGTYSDGLVLLTSEHLTNGKMNVSLSLFSNDDNKVHETNFGWEEGSITYVLDRYGNLYFNEFGKSGLQVRNLASGKTSEIDADLTLGKDGVFISLTDSIRDNHLTYYLNQNESPYSSISCALNLSTLETFEIALPYDSADNDGRKVSIYAETETNFIILCGMRYVSTGFTDSAENKYPYEEQVFDYALISKSDYWNSKANYTYLTEY